MDIYKYLRSFIFFDDNNYKFRGNAWRIPKFFEDMFPGSIEIISKKIGEILLSIVNYCKYNNITVADLENCVVENGILTKDVESRWRYADYSNKVFQVIFIAYHCIPRFIDVMKMFFLGTQKGMIHANMGNICCIGAGPMLEAIFFEMFFLFKYKKIIVIDTYDLNDWEFSYNVDRTNRVKRWSDDDFDKYSVGLSSYGSSSVIIQDRNKLISEKKIILSIESHGTYREDIHVYVPFDTNGAYGCYCDYSFFNFKSCVNIRLEKNNKYEFDVFSDSFFGVDYIADDCSNVDAVEFHTAIHIVEEDEEKCSKYGDNCTIGEIDYNIIGEEKAYDLYVKYINRAEYYNNYDNRFCDLNGYCKKFDVTYYFDCDYNHSKFGKIKSSDCDCDIILCFIGQQNRIRRVKLEDMIDDAVAHLLYECGKQESYYIGICNLGNERVSKLLREYYKKKKVMGDVDVIVTDGRKKEKKKK